MFFQNIIEKLLVVFALVLELEDEQYFVKRHLYDAEGEDHLRYMKYKARTAEQNAENNLYTGGHTVRIRFSCICYDCSR